MRNADPAVCAYGADISGKQLYRRVKLHLRAHSRLFCAATTAAKITLNDLAALCHCSKSYISHIFKKHSGLSVRAYINQIRLSEAKRLLADTALSIKEISDMVGFSDPNYFSNTFRAAFSASQKQYRAALHLDV